MAHTRAAQAAAQRALPSPASNHRGNRSQGIRPRKGTSRERTPDAERHRFPTKPSETPSPHDPPVPVQSRGRKRKHSVERALEPSPDDRGPRPGIDLKRRRTSSPHATEDAFGEPATRNSPIKHTDPVAFWAKEGRWPEGISETDFTMDRVLARKKSPSNPRKRSISATSATPSDQKPREEKSAPYRDPRYRTLLEIKGSCMSKSELGIIDESKTLCQTLLETPQAEPQDSLFRSDIFELSCRKVEDRNEARVLRDITPLIVPPAEILYTYGTSTYGTSTYGTSTYGTSTYGTSHLTHVIESVNEGWNNSIPLTSTRPQPDYSVGFRRETFTKDQLAKLSPFLGDFLAGDQSLFMATYYMYFPFLTCEVKCGAAALDTADRQNAHSMTLAVRGVAELFRAVKREDDVNRKILAFSVSHDDRSVRIYGHYPVVDKEKDIKYYRHPIHEFSFTALDGKERWTAYRFTKNVYDLWMPGHLKIICSAIDQLPPSLDVDVAPLSETTGLSQDLGNLMEPDADERGSQSSSAERQAATPDTSFSEAAKRRRDRMGQMANQDWISFGGSVA